MTSIHQSGNNKRFSDQHRALLKEARERLCLITVGFGALHPMSEQYSEIESVISEIEDLLEIRQ